MAEYRNFLFDEDEGSRANSDISRSVSIFSVHAADDFERKKETNRRMFS